MKRDRFVGATVSAMSLGTLLLAFNGAGRKAAPASALPSETLSIVMPDPLPEPPEQEAAELPDQPDSTQTLVAPPSLIDVPNIVAKPEFTQAVAPPPPPGLKPDGSVVTLPAHRGFGGTAISGHIFTLNQLDRRPVARVQQQPLYPYDMRKDGIEGEVEVGFVVTATGDVVSAYVIRSTKRAFEAYALQAVSHWKFRPGMRGGRAVNTRMSVPIVFHLDE